MKKPKIKEKIIKDDFSNEIYAYTLANAIEHGEARVNAVLPKLFRHGLNKERINAVIPIIEEIVRLVNAMPVDERKNKFGDFNKNLQKLEQEIEQYDDINYI